MVVLGYKLKRDPDGTIFVSTDEIVLTNESRRQGVYVMGTTGTGKSTLLRSIAYQDMKSGAGLCVIDPHGDMIDELLLRVPPERAQDVILFAPGSKGSKRQYEWPLGFNLFDCNRTDPRERQLVASTILDTLYKLFSTSWGPRMEYLLRNAILTLLETPDTTFLELWLMLADKNQRDNYIKDIRDPALRQFWKVQFPLYEANARDLVDLVGSSLNKIGRFVTDPVLRNVVAQPKSSFNIRNIMDSGKILLVNLSKGELGEENSALVGAVLVSQILSAALQRREIPPPKRRPFHLIVDEYQNFATSSFPTLQSEARKYAIDVMVAHQYRDQLDDLNKGSTLNVANFIVLRASGRDSYELASQFDNTPPPPDLRKEPYYQRNVDREGTPFFTEGYLPGTDEKAYQEVEQPRRAYNDVQAETANDLATLENYQAVCRIFEGRHPREHTMALIEPEKRADLYGYPDRAVDESIHHRMQGLGRARLDVEQDIETRIGDLDFHLPIDTRRRLDD